MRHKEGEGEIYEVVGTRAIAIALYWKLCLSTYCIISHGDKFLW